MLALVVPLLVDDVLEYCFDDGARSALATMMGCRGKGLFHIYALLSNPLAGLRDGRELQREEWDG